MALWLGHDRLAASLIFSEARLLAFPTGAFAWITCPLLLRRAQRDGALKWDIPAEPADGDAIFKENGPLDLGGQIVIEAYCFKASATRFSGITATALAALVPDDALFQSVADRLVVVSNGTLSHFVTSSCEVAQHVRISDETGTAEGTGLFNQENVSAATLFHSVLRADRSRVPRGEFEKKSPEEAPEPFQAKIDEIKVFQFGGDASTGLGF